MLLLIIIILFLLICYKNKERFARLNTTNGYEPEVDLDKWNKNWYIRYSHNCYQYFLNKIDKDLIKRCKKKCSYVRNVPGHYNKRFMKKRYNYSCPLIYRRIKEDNPLIYKINKYGICKPKYYKGAFSVKRNDTFHFYRMNPDGTWSHKDAGYPASDRYFGKKIRNPEMILKDKYPEFCGYVCIPSIKYHEINVGRLKKF